MNITILKDKWHGLTSRERYLLAGGSFFVALLLFYSVFWEPMTRATERLQEKQVQQRALLQWMSGAKQRIDRLRAAGFQVREKSSGSLLVLVERTVSDKKLNSYLKQVTQPEKGQILVKLAGVPFDQAVEWLRSLWRQHGVDVEQISVIRTATKGLVNMQVTLAAV